MHDALNSVKREMGEEAFILSTRTKRMKPRIARIFANTSNDQPWHFHSRSFASFAVPSFKTFEATSTQDALNSVKREMDEEAFILPTPTKHMKPRIARIFANTSNDQPWHFHSRSFASFAVPSFKTFEAASMQDALNIVKREMDEEAFILSTRAKRMKPRIVRIFANTNNDQPWHFHSRPFASFAVPSFPGVLCA